MPLIDLYLPADAVPSDRLPPLVDELTTVLLRAERAPDTEFFRGITWVYVHELPQGMVFTSGRPAPEPVFRVSVTVPQGALSERRKEELVTEATRAVREATGLGEDDSLRIWVMVNEVPDGNWGEAGNVIRFEQLRELATQAREQPAAPVSVP